MKIQLKKFPNGARFIYNNTECVRLIRNNSVIIIQVVSNGVKLLLHPDTYVQPIEFVEDGK